MDILKQTIRNLNINIDDDVPNTIMEKDIKNAVKILEATDKLINYLKTKYYYNDSFLLGSVIDCLLLDEGFTYQLKK